MMAKMAMIFLVIFVLIQNFQARAGEQRRVLLSDGSSIVAEVISLKGGVYLLQSTQLGRISIPSDRVKSIERIIPVESTKTVSSPSTAQTNTQTIEQLKEQMINDQKSLELILQLSVDPLMKLVLEDEALMKKVLAGDLESLAKDSRIQALMEHKKIQEISDRTKVPQVKP